VTASADAVLDLLRSRGLRMTPQRRAIVTEIMSAEGHIAPARVADRVRERVPGVNASTVYRTLAMLEEMGVLAHAHLESGPEYHRSSESGHVHLICARCRKGDELSLAEAARLKALIEKHHGFEPDLSHFAISGLCRDCRQARGSRPSRRRTPGGSRSPRAGRSSRPPS
jgi:Fur family ferric uptake transcriptional regulator